MNINNYIFGSITAAGQRGKQERLIASTEDVAQKVVVTGANVVIVAPGIGTKFDSANRFLNDPKTIPEVDTNSDSTDIVSTDNPKTTGNNGNHTVDPLVENEIKAKKGYTRMDNGAYTKDGKTYYYNNKEQKMETKEERIDSSLNMISEYLNDLHSKMPNNSYVNKLLDLVTNHKDQIKNDIGVIDFDDIPGMGGSDGFGGLGKISIDDDTFNKMDITDTASKIMHELVHYSDGDNITSKTEEMDAKAMEDGMKHYYGLATKAPEEEVAVINDFYKIDHQEGSKHMLNDSNLDELRTYLGFGESVQAGVKKDNPLSSFTGGFINGGGTVLGAGIDIGGRIGGIFGKKGETIGRWIGAAVAAVPAVVTGVVVGVVNAVINVVAPVVETVTKFFKKLFHW